MKGQSVILMIVAALLLVIANQVEAAGCSAGSSGTPCTPCPSGYYCTGGDASAVVCPTGFKCAAGSSAPEARKLKGVNLSFGEINPDEVPGKYGTNYVYPSISELNYFSALGFGVIRVPFSINRMQPVNNAPLNTAELGYLQTTVTNAINRNLTVVLDPHNYGRMYNSSSGKGVLLGVAGGLPASVFGDFWSRMATVFKGQSTKVIFGLMNEPNVQTAKEWHDVAIVAINAIRSTGANNKILIPGTAYTGAYSWISRGNAAAWSGFNDINFAFEVHQYLDGDNSGTHTECKVGQGSSGLVAVTNWARNHSYELFLGEFGWAANAGCATEATPFLNYMRDNADVWLGWTYWAAGAWWGDYMFSIEPRSLSTMPPLTWREQTTILLADVNPALLHVPSAAAAPLPFSQAQACWTLCIMMALSTALATR